MPKTRIKERDLTPGAPEIEAYDLVFLAGTGSGEDKLTVCHFAKDLEAIVNKDTNAFKMAQYLIKNNMYVVYCECAGADGPSEETWKKMTDKAFYDVRFIDLGDFAGNEAANIAAAKCAAKRGDAIALIDAPNGVEKVDAVRAEFKKVVDAVSELDTQAAIEEKLSSAASYSAGFTPWIRTKDAAFTDSDAGTELPGSFGYLAAYAKSTLNNVKYAAAAGSARGVIDFIDAPLYQYSTDEIEVLQGRAATGAVELDDDADNTDFAINPIAYVRPFGYLVWGNRTLLANGGKVKCTGFLNVRQLITTVKKALYDAANKYRFDLNTDILYSKFKNEVAPILDNAVSGSGLVGYRWKKIATNKKARLAAKLILIPIEGVEDFDLTVELSDTLTVAE